MSIEKSMIELYKLRKIGPHKVWADISLDIYEKQGRISIASDYGDWQYFWGSCGCSFKEFLTDLDIHYTAGKFGADRFFDIDKTISSIKHEILYQRREECIDEDEARDCWNEIRELNDCTQKNEFCAIVYANCSHIMGLYDTGPDVCYDIEPGFRCFWEEVWPVFTEELKRELAEEGGQDGK